MPQQYQPQYAPHQPYQTPPPQPPQQAQRTSDEPVLDENIVAITKKAPEDFAREWAKAQLEKKYGEDFEFDPTESNTPGTRSAEYIEDRTLYLNRGLQVHNEAQGKVAKHNEARQQQIQGTARSVLSREYGIPEQAYDKIVEIAGQIENTPETYFRMVFNHLDRLGYLQQFRGPNGYQQGMPPQGQYPMTPQQLQNGQHMVHPQPTYPQTGQAPSQPTYPQGYAPQNGYPQNPQQATLMPQNNSFQQQMAPPMPGIPAHQIPGGQPYGNNAPQQTFQEMFPADMLPGAEGW
jgi:hypothetical protein